MKNYALALMASLIFLGFGCSKSCEARKQNKPTISEQPSTNLSKEQEIFMKDFNLKPGDKLYATFNTSLGEIKAELFWEKAPMTVLNFVELAEGKKEWTHPKTQETLKKPLYDGTIFHRVIKGFMIQGGDPMGSGFGGPGFKFKDEFSPDLKHDKKGILSMANSGPNTNGSQFFITDAPTPHLNGRHSVFGQVTDASSLDLISKIASVETSAQDRPKEDVVLKTIKISKE